MPTNTAAFGPSSQTQIGFGPGTSATVAGIAFVSGAPPYAFVFGGGEVSFSDSASAGTARFTVYGSTSTTDGDTFGNVVFHDTSTAAGGTFTNAGGTVAGGDGGNTQFYDDATAGSGKY